MQRLQVELKNGKLNPITKYDAEKIEEFASGSVFNLTPTKIRSNQHHNLYWAALRNACKATGKWPTEKHLHNELKWSCGYAQLKFNKITGEHMRLLDSISFDTMTQKEFSEYFELAMQKLSEAIGFDPLEQPYK